MPADRARRQSGSKKPGLLTYRMDLQYDGSPFHGWAKQPGLPTVEASVEEAFRTVLGQVPSLTVAGRTDSGVHARRQTVSVPLRHGVQCRRLMGSLNALTPPEISVRNLAPAAGFDARADAQSRSYRYFVWCEAAENPFLRRYSWFVRRRLDVSAMNEAARSVVGRHDLTAFTPTQTEHVHFHRIIDRCCWRRRGALVWLEIEAPSFLRQMVRALVGTMVEVGVGSRSADEVRTLLQGAPRREAGFTAPAHGLFLWRIRY